MPTKKENQADDALSTDAFLAEIERKHGIEAARAVEKAMKLPPPKHQPVPRRVGVRQNLRRGAIPNLRVNPPGTAPTPKERAELRRMEEAERKPTVRILIAGRYIGRYTCEGCGTAIGAGNEVVKVTKYLDLRDHWYHTGCVPTDLPWLWST